MKRLLLLLFVLISSLSPSSKVFASHGMGGEITWTCLPSGQFRFEMKFYRDCNGIAGPASVLMETTVPGIPTITLNLFQQNDISPDGLASNGITTCPTCAQGNFGNPIPGLVEEFIYRSNPISLPGVPPAAGWMFSWGECCRSSALTNITGAGSIGFLNRAIMYPYNMTSTSPCFDSSPYFAEKPSTIICTGYPFKYNPNAVDPELDSLVYSWGQPLDDAGNVIPFAPGYNVNSQLPSVTQHPSNVAATIHPSTGEISYTSFTGGYFATVVKVTAYKCGIKVAEIFREINVVMNNNCPPVNGGQNLPPQVNAPFFDPVTGLQTAYIDTVYAGDTVNFMLTVQDFQFFTNMNMQNITIEASGSQFGTGFTNPNAGCLIPPCATMTPGLPTTFPLAGQVTFNWRTTCAHNQGLDTLCTRISNTYNFVIKATDNYCPANASNVSTITVVVLPPPKLDPPVLRCASVNLDGSVTLNWTKPTPRDSQDTYYSYEIYSSLAAGGPWTLVDSVLTPYLNPASYSYTHSLANLTALYGTNAQQQSIYYHIKTTSGCSGDSISNPSNILRTIKLNANLNGLNEAVLTWNALSTPPLSSHSSYYRIYKQFPLGTWTLIDSTTLLTFTDTTTKFICNDTVSYRVELADSTGCISVSSLDGININNPNPIAVIVPANPDFCLGGSVVLTCSTPGLAYLWNTGAVTNSITASTAGTYTVTVTQNGGCTSSGTTTVTVNPNPVINITGINVICQGQNTTFDAGAGYSYVWSTGAVTQTVSLNTAGTYTVTVTDANGCTAVAIRNLTVNANPVPNITGITSICQGTTTTLNAGGGYTGYAWSGGLPGTQTVTVGTAGNYTVTVTNAAGCTGTTSTAVTVNPLPNPNITGDNSICAGQNTTFDAGAGFTSYLWSNGNGTQTTTVTNANTYTVTVTDANGCTNTDNITLTVNPNPVPVITGNNVICQGQNTTFNAGPGFTYVWSTGAVTQTVNLNTAGSYTVTVTDPNGCTGTAVRNLTVNANPVPVISGTTVICQGQSTTLNAGPGYTGYSWTGGGGGSSQTLSTGTGGNYTVTVTAANGCTGTASTTVTVNPLPTPVIAGDLDFCQGSNTTLNANAGYTNYLWSTGASSQSITISTATTVTVTVTDNNGCVNNTSATTVVNPNPVPVITGNNVICQGQNTTFNAGPGYTYVWSTGAVTQTVNLNTAGTYTVTVTDPNGCVGTAVRNLTVNANPVPVISGTTVICQGQTTTLNAGPGYTGYSWTGGGGGSTQTLSTGTGGNYTVTVTAVNGCTGTASTLVTVNPLPTPVISGDLDFCQGFNTTLDAGAGYTNYLWSTGATSQTVTVNNATTLTVTVTDNNGCVNNTSASTVVNPNPVPNITGTFTTCDGTTTLIDGGAGYSGYLWSTGATTQTINIGTAGLVTVTVTDANGCVGTDNTNITVFALPTATLSGIDTICFGQSSSIQVNFGGPGPYTYTYFDGTANQGPFNSAGAVANISVTPGASTNYTLVSVSNANCTGTISGTASIQVTPLPSATLTGTTAICDGDNTNLTISFTGVAPFTYSYLEGSTVVGPFTTATSPVTINVAPGNTTTYGMTATLTGAGCVGTTNAATATITVNDLPTASISGNNTICAGESTDLTLNFVGTGPFTYSYTDGLNNYGPFTTPNNPATVSISPGTSVNCTLISISDANCAGSVSGSAAITVNPLPTATMSGTAVICDGANTNLSILFTGTGPFTYSYNDGSTVFGPFTTNQNPVLINVNPTVNTVYGVTAINDANCLGTSSGTADITVIPLPTSDLTGTTEICMGSNTNMTVTFTGVPPFEYMYNDGSITYGPFTTNNYTTNINVAPVVNTSYHITTVTGYGCAGTPNGVVDITVNAIPDASLALTGDDILCDGESSEFELNFTGIAPFTYSYTDGSTTYGPFTTSNNPEIIPVTPGSTSNYSIVTFSDDKCAGTMAGSALVTVNPLPVATVSGSPSICNGTGTSFTVGFTGTGPYVYTYSDGSVTYGPFTTSNNPETIQVAPTVTTSYNVVTVSDANCVGSATGVASVTVNQIPSAVLTGDASICDGDATDLNIAFNGVAPFTYTYFNGTSNIGPLTSASSPVTISVSPGSSTTYTLVSISDAYCPGTLSGSAEVTVNPLPQPVITGDFEICDGESSTLTATPGFQAYTWSSGSTTPSIVSTTPGVFTVTVTDLNGCVGTSPAINLIVNQTPVVSFTNDTSLTCEIPEINFFNTSTFPSNSVFAWEFGDGSTSALPNPSHIFSTPGTYSITLTITTTNGCTNTHTQPAEIMFYPLPEAKFTPSPYVTNIFNARIQFTDESQNAVSWLWEMGDGAKSIEQNPYHYYNDIGEFVARLTVTNIAGCIDTYELPVVVNPFYIPNAFTPNADGINDYFFDAGYVLDVQSYKMIIFSRWGDRVYEGDDYTKFWNGFDRNGNIAPEGVYVYSIEVVTKGGKKHDFHGTVSLIR